MVTNSKQHRLRRARKRSARVESLGSAGVVGGRQEVVFLGVDEGEERRDTDSRMSARTNLNTKKYILLQAVAQREFWNTFADPSERLAANKR
jgi:hypothetical protein